MAEMAGALMNNLTIRLFGRISVEQRGQPLPGLPSKALELLSYLLVHRERGHTREALASLFWPEAPDYRSRKYLRQAMWRLQAALGDRDGQAREGAAGLLIVRADWIRVNQETDYWLDVAAFERAYRLYRDTPGGELTDGAAEELDAAAALYRGDLIESSYQDWCVRERDRLQLTYLAMLGQLVLYCEARRRYEKGIFYGQSILRHDPAQECTHRHLMRLYYHSGDRTAALRQYDRCAAALAKHFELEPARETVALCHQIRDDRLAGPDAGAERAARTDGEIHGDVLSGLTTTLDLIQTSLAALRRQVQQELVRSAGG